MQVKILLWFCGWVLQINHLIRAWHHLQKVLLLIWPLNSCCPPMNLSCPSYTPSWNVSETFGHFQDVLWHLGNCTLKYFVPMQFLVAPGKQELLRPAYCHASSFISELLVVTEFQYSFHSAPPSAAYLCRWIGSALIQIMAYSLFGAKPLSKPMLGYCQLDPKEQTWVKF